ARPESARAMLTEILRIAHGVDPLTPLEVGSWARSLLTSDAPAQRDRFVDVLKQLVRLPARLRTSPPAAPGGSAPTPPFVAWRASWPAGRSLARPADGGRLFGPGARRAGRRRRSPAPAASALRPGGAGRALLSPRGAPPTAPRARGAATRPPPAATVQSPTA